jgi:hypothetical protein
MQNFILIQNSRSGTINSGLQSFHIRKALSSMTLIAPSSSTSCLVVKTPSSSCFWFQFYKFMAWFAECPSGSHCLLSIKSALGHKPLDIRLNTEVLQPHNRSESEVPDFCSASPKCLWAPKFSGHKFYQYSNKVASVVLHLQRTALYGTISCCQQ